MRLRALLVSSLVLLCTARSGAQQRKVEAVDVTDKLGILAAGRLLGYFRDPDIQVKTFDKCSAIDKRAGTASAGFLNELETRRAKLGVPDITLAVGDNFAPELLARVLDIREKPDDVPWYGTKDRYTWKWEATDPRLQTGEWVPYDNKKAELPVHVKDALHIGKGFIPADNVACFFLGAGFDVVVPGHHDFYYGAERLRMLARLMATPTFAYRTGALPAPAHAVQMLATNLVIRTTFVKERLPRRESPRKLGFETSSQVIKPTVVTDGDLVLPYARKFGFAYDTSKVTVVRVSLRQVDPTDKLWRSKPAVDLELVDDLTAEQALACKTKSCERKWALPAGTGLDALTNYRVCVEEKPIPDAKARLPVCVRFSVDAPFFQYPSKRPWGEKSDKTPYNDPQPFFVKRDADDNVMAVVFGAVHPKLRERVGQLNFAWRNTNKRYKTEIAVVEPARALAQAVDYFEYWFEQDRCRRLTGDAQARCKAKKERFGGDRILVAQMPPPEARELGARVAGGFAVVVSEAETARATPNQEIRYERPLPPSLPAHSANPPEPPYAPTFLLVPRPSYDTTEGNAVDIRSLTLGQTTDGTREKVYRLSGQRQKPSTGKRASFCSEPSFRRTVAAAMAAIDASSPTTAAIDASAAGIDSDATCRKALHELSLYAMRRRLKTDVALLQKRDFFFDGLPEGGSLPPLGEIMKRILWKGDFLTELMVPGSTLKTVLKQGKAFDQDDAASLSLAVEKERGILTLGITLDTERKEYLVNGRPLEDGRLYTVATSDYAGQGDTGFAELMTTAIHPTVKAHEFRKLYPIDEIVAQDLAENMSARRSAVKEITAAHYLDAITQAPADTSKGLSWYGRVGRWFFLGRNRRVFGEMSLAEREVQNRVEPFFALQKLSGSWSELRNNFDEQDRQDKFSGTVIPQLNATEARALTFASQARGGVSLRSFEWYVSDDLGYSTTATAQKKLPRLTTYPENKAIVETGIFQRLLGKAFPRVGPQLSYRLETQLRAPMETFTLKEGEGPLTRPFKRSVSRIWRVGGRFESRHSSVTAGFQYASSERPVQYVFQTAGRAGVMCTVPDHAGKLLDGEMSLADCVKQNAAGAEPLIDGSSSVFLSRRRQSQNGVFLDGKLVIPLVTRLSFTSEHHLDRFRYHESESNALIRVRYATVQALDLKLFGNLSLQPSLSTFYFKGQGASSETFHQWKASMGLNYVFDWFGGNSPRALTRGK